MNIAKETLKEKYLYKFRNIIKDSYEQTKPDEKKLSFIERIFTHNELYFPSPISLNDPLECRPYIKVGNLSDISYKKKYISYSLKTMISGGNTADPKEITRWLESHTQEEAEKLCGQLTDSLRNDLLEKYRICSFSAVNDNPLLWSHYADSHQGFCLIFDADNEEFGSAMEVRYQDEYPVVDYIEEDEFEVMKNSGFVKFTDWSYEKEFRLVSAEPNFVNVLKVINNIWEFPQEMLIGVIFGYKMSGSDQSIVKGFCGKRANDIAFKKAMLSDNNFYLNIVDI